MKLLAPYAFVVYGDSDELYRREKLRAKNGKVVVGFLTKMVK